MFATSWLCYRSSICSEINKHHRAEWFSGVDKGQGGILATRKAQEKRAWLVSGKDE